MATLSPPLRLGLTRLSVIMTRVKKALVTLSCPPVACSSSSRITRLQEKGFSDFVMPARRVFFFFQDNTAAAANADGWKLFDTAVDWAQNLITVSAQPKFAPPTISSGNLQLSWSGSGTLQQTDSVTTTNCQSDASKA